MGLDLYVNDENVMHIGYGSFNFLRKDIATFYGVKELGYYFPGNPDDENFVNQPATNYEGVTEEQMNQNSQLREYVSTIQDYEQKGLLPLFVLIQHSDCDGEIDFTMCEKLIPILEKAEKCNERMPELIAAVKKSAESKANLIFA